jgi:1-acyl-sn-glycerol-3-phosphate acyltransferase
LQKNNIVENFDSIRPFKDDEVEEVLKKYSESSVFKKLVNHVYPTWENDVLPKKLKKIKSTSAFQQLFIYPAVKAAIDRSMSHFTISGLDNINPDENYLFISNHRDIVLDSTLLFYVLFQNEYQTGETAIGNNLLSSDLVNDIVRLNQNFVVKRNLPNREMILASKELSKYIRHVITQKNKSIWISHREGRTKDGNDRTNPGVLKMLAMDCDKNKIEYLLNLKLVPVTISYEFESCDHLKAAELTEIELTGSYKKDGTEDMKSIITGITQQKGRVHLSIDKPVQKEDIDLSSDKIQDHFKNLADYIDRRIHENFKLFPGNYIAYDLLHDGNPFSDKYNAWEENKFTEYIQQILTSYKESKGYEIFKRILLDIYANPVSNQIAINKL